MTQPDAFISTETPATRRTKASDLWIAGAVILGVVFFPALIAGVISLFAH